VLRVHGQLEALRILPELGRRGGDLLPRLFTLRAVELFG
jgi:hypothetical protein